MSEETNYNVATGMLDKIIKYTSPETIATGVAMGQMYASLAVADELRTLNELLRSFGLGDTQGGRTFEVSVKK
jgi:hypothetical protein